MGWAHENGRRSARGRILYVEDEALVRMDVADGLRQAQFAVIEAGSADEALTLVDAGMEFDVLVADVRMPGRLDGVGLALEIRRRRPEIPVVFASAFVKAYIPVEEAIILGKPFTIAAAVALIRSLISTEPADDDGNAVCSQTG